MNAPPTLRPGDELTADWLARLVAWCRPKKIVCQPPLYATETPDAWLIRGDGSGSGGGGAINILTGSGGIPARSGATMGSATCTAVAADASGVLATGTTLTVWNISSVAVGGSKYGIAVMVGGLWEIVVESCG